MQNSTNTNNPVPQPLAERSLLHERYIVGPVAGAQTQYIVNYIGFDKRTKKKVVLRELFPSQFCTRARDGKSVVALSTEHQVSFQTIKDKFTSQAQQYPVIPHASIHSGVEVFDENGTAYQVTDYVTGIDLPAYLAKKGGRLSEHDTLQLFMPLLDGLQQVHDFGLQHGYISPEAIRVVKEGESVRFVLMNLGIPPKQGARVIPGYTPPEATIGDRSADKLTDMYGIAATLYTCVTGAKPPAAAERVQNPSLPKLTDASFGLSANMQAGILAGMYVNPTDRMRTPLNLKLSILGETEDALIPERDLAEADESLFEGVERVPGAESGVSPSSNKNAKLLIGLILGTILVILVPGWFLIVSPILDTKNAMEEMFSEGIQDMDSYVQMDTAVATDEPIVQDESQMTQREIEVQRMLTQGENLLSMGNIDEAVATYQRAASMTPNDPQVHLALGRAYVKGNKSREAIQSFEKVLRLDPNNGEAYGSLGFIYFDSQREPRAYDHFRKAAALGDQVTISFLQSEAGKGNSSAQSVLSENGLRW